MNRGCLGLQRKIIRMIGMLAMLLLFLPASAWGAGREAVHELNYFHYEVVDAPEGDLLRIEIGMDRSITDYKVSENPNKPKQLTIDLPNTEIGALRSDITLDGKFARYMTLRELERRHIQVMVSLAKQVKDQQYKVYTLEADRKQGKPFRLVIDVSLQPAPGKAAESDQQVSGVTGHTIVLDPGHGGSDSGAVGPNGTQEKDVTLAIAQKVRDILTASGARVVMTRTDDHDVYGPDATDRQELQARVNIGAYTPDMQLFLSIHANSFSSPSAHGTETFYYPRSTRDAHLAQALQDSMIAVNGLADRGISEANFYVIKHSTVPSALVELAFISNYREEQLLASADFQNKMALAICQGLGNFFKNEGM